MITAGAATFLRGKLEDEPGPLGAPPPEKTPSSEVVTYVVTFGVPITPCFTTCNHPQVIIRTLSSDLPRPTTATMRIPILP